MVDGGTPETAHGRHARQRRGGWSSRRLRVVLVGMCFAAATVALPPLVARHQEQSPSTVPTPAPTISGDSTAMVAPISPTASAIAAANSTSPAARFAPISVQAEDPGNLLTGEASVIDCATCEGGYRVRYLCLTCKLVVRTTLPVSGERKITVVYEAKGPREIKISINGALPVIQKVSGPDWTTPRTFHFTRVLPAGSLRLTFYNDRAAAPDIDKIVIS